MPRFLAGNFWTWAAEVMRHLLLLVHSRTGPTSYHYNLW